MKHKKYIHTYIYVNISKIANEKNEIRIGEGNEKWNTHVTAKWEQRLHRGPTLRITNIIHLAANVKTLEIYLKKQALANICPINGNGNVRSGI